MTRWSSSFCKNSWRRGAAISIDALSYVKRRIERSYAAIESFARNANALAMAENAPVNLLALAGLERVA